jgi:AraC-like DNA-binding protein
MGDPVSPGQRGEARTSTTGLRRIRIEIHRSEHGYTESAFGEPAAPLVAHVNGLYQGWIEQTSRSVRRREVPSGFIPLILNFGSAFRMIDPGDPAGPGQSRRSFVAGLHESFALVESTGSSICMQVNITPLAAHLVLGVPMDSLANRVVELDDVLGATSRRLVERLGNASSWEERFDILDSFLAERLLKARPISAGIIWAWETLNETVGQVPIGTLAERLGCSHKHLIALFHAQVGLPPKMLARVLRFQRVIEQLKADDGRRWVEIAHDCGYYDQAHLIRDFRSFAGSSPTEFLGRQLPDGGVSGD